MSTLINRLDVFWLAGILEGEGCFFFNKTPMILLSMTDKDIIDKVAKLFGKEQYREQKPRGRGKKNVFSTDVYGTNAINIMLTILPYMGERRTYKINEVLSLAKARSGVAFGEQQGASKVSDYQAFKIKQQYLNRTKNETGLSIGKKYGISQAAVHYIANQRKFPNPKYFTIDFQYSFDF